MQIKQYQGWKNGTVETLLDVKLSRKVEENWRICLQHFIQTIKMDDTKMPVFHAEFASFHQLILVNATAVHKSHPHEQHVAHHVL